MKEKEKDIFDKIMALPGLNIFEGFYQKYKEMLLYLFFGGMTAVISIGSYSYCDVGLGFDPLIANIISWILAVTFAYVTNKVWVFSVETVYRGFSLFYRTLIYTYCRRSDTVNFY